MASLEEVNRLLNRGHRALNDVAVQIASSDFADKTVALSELAEAMERLMRVQQRVFKYDPDLEYHHDPARPPTAFMRSVADLVVQAESLLARGDRDAAVALLDKALSLEPPPLAYESISNKRVVARK